MARKRTIAKQKQAEAIAQASADRMTQSNTLHAMGFGSTSTKKTAVDSARRLKRRSTSKNDKDKIVDGESNLYDSALQEKSASILLAEVRKEFGAGSQVYVNVMSTIQDVKTGKVTAVAAAEMAEITLKACDPIVPKDKIARYCELIANIERRDPQGGLSTAAESFLPAEGLPESISSAL